MAEDRKTTSSGVREDFERAKGGAREEWNEAKSHLSDAARRAREEASHSGSTIASSVQRELDRRRDDMAHGLHDLAGSLHRVAREGEGRLPGGLVDRAADTIDEFADTLERRSLRDLTGRVEEYGREHPAAFVAGAMLAGFALGRFLTASGPRSHAQGYTDDDDWGRADRNHERDFGRDSGTSSMGRGAMPQSAAMGGTGSGGSGSGGSGKGGSGKGGGVSRGYDQAGLPAGSGRGIPDDSDDQSKVAGQSKVTGQSKSPATANTQYGQGSATEPGKAGGAARSSAGLPEQQPGMGSVKPQPGVPLPDPKGGSSSAHERSGFDDPQKKGD